MNIKKSLILLVVLLTSITIMGQNTLSIPDNLQSKAGNNISVPIMMTNNEDVIAVQFDVQLPFRMPSGAKPTLSSSRAKDHTLATRSIGSNKYTVLITNLQNRAITGSAGTLVSIPMTINSDAQLDDAYPITLTNVVLTNRRGDNIATGSTNGAFTLQRDNSPDLEVYGVNIKQSALAPGNQIDVTWNVRNIGSADTKSGWRESITLVSSTGTSVNLGTVYNNDILVKNGSTIRSASFTLPTALGIEGDVTAKVEVVTTTATGEYVADKANNIATGGNCEISKLLTLTCPSATIDEGQTARFTLTRSGDKSMDETFVITNSLTKQLTVPTSITIPAGRSYATFDVKSIDDEDPNDELVSTITIKANYDYESVSRQITISDNDLVPMSISFDKPISEKYNEGETIHLTISLPKRIGSEDITVNIGVDLPKRFKVPRTVTIPAGKKEVTVDIPIVDDNIPENETSVEFSISAERYQSQTKHIILADNDIPAIEMSITPSTISENAGANAIYATITRKEATNSKITVKISDSSKDELYYNNTITLNEGVTDATFPISVKNNTMMEGERTIKLYAEVYITSCGCSAIGNKQTQVEKDITILDDDGPTLFVSSNKTTVLEGDATGAVITVTRNTNTANPLTVTLSTEAKDVDMVKTITIPAGSASVTTTFKALRNSTEEGNRAITIKATANGFTAGTGWILISDQSFPDLNFVSLNSGASTYFAGDKMTYTVNMENVGANAMPQGSLIKLFIDNNLASTVTLAEDIPAGSSKQVVMTVDEGVKVPGKHTVKVELNANKIHTELQTINNTGSMEIEVLSKYKFAISANKDKFKPGEPVTFTGSATLHDGTPASNTEVEIYVICANSRTPITATTDAEGNFTSVYTANNLVTGDFTYGICTPSEGLKTAYGSYSIYGIARATNDYIKNNMYVDEPYAETIILKNMGSQPLTNVRATTSDPSGRYDVVVVPISRIEGKGEGELSYIITPNSQSTSKDWDRIMFHIESDEGAELDVTTYNYTYTHFPQMELSTTSINTTVTKGTTRNYPIQVTNTGIAETGKITVSLPQGLSNFVSLATPSVMESLGTGDTATVVLRFNAADYDVNIFQKGRIAINCENGDGKALNFNVKVVSEEKGNLLVKAANEFTQNGDINGNRSYIAGATVKVADYNTGAIICRTITDETGQALINDIPEGYYKLTVSAEKNTTYNQNIFINPGETTEHIATLSYQAVSYTWDVVETTVEDEYEIKTSVTYETYVPRPVLKMTAPDTLDIRRITKDQPALINVILRNTGFITATDISLILPTHPEVEFTPFVNCDGFELAANQSITIPVLVSLKSPAAAARTRRAEGANCNGKFGAPYKWPCGEGSAFSWLEKPIQFLTNIACGEKKPASFEPIKPAGGGPGGPGGSGGGVTIGAGGEAVVAAVVKLFCLLCECFCPDPMPPTSATDLAKTAAEKLGGTPAKCIVAAATSDAKLRKIAGDSKPTVIPALLKSSGRKSTLYYTYYNIENDYMAERTNAHQLIADLESRKPILDALKVVDARLEAMYNAGSLYTTNINQLKSEMKALMPMGDGVYQDLNMNDYVERIVNTYKHNDGIAVNSDNYISDDVLRILEERKDSCQQALFELGFVDWDELIQSAHKDWVEYQEGASKNTCAEVKLEISQKLVLTRQAFRGTLTITNGSNTTLTNVKADVTATDSNGKYATSREMEIHVESIDGFEGSLDGEWTLPAGAKGVATFLFIPTKYAAPDTLTTYHFGGTLYFTEDEENRTQTLYPVALQVKPSPVLDLTYFMQRDIYGDNPLTPDVIEPVIPAEFSVLIHNKGKGEATNVRMITEQPKIVENQKGLMVDFKIVSSSLNGGEKAMALDKSIATQFGDIPAGTCSYATWDLTSSLLGHFTDYDVSYTHLTSYGNPDLSLLDQVTIHELIHSATVKIGNIPYRAWITNDDEDGHDEPDHIYFSNGTDENLDILKSSTMVEKLNGETNSYRISVTVPQKEWFYTSIANPTSSHAKLLSITNETTGKELFADNFWTTEYTIQDGFDPVEDKRIHILDLSEGPSVISYIVTFEPAPDVELDVKSIGTVPDDDDIAEAPIEELTVTFNKGIDASTFTREDIVLRHEGKILDVDIPVTQVEGSTDKYKLDTSALTENGFYNLQVSSANIVDDEGYKGYNGKNVTWMLFKDGLIKYNIGFYPSNRYGTITLDEAIPLGYSGEAKYKKTFTLTAVTNLHYEFDGWYEREIIYYKDIDDEANNSKRRKAAEGGSSNEVKSLEGYTRYSSSPVIELSGDKDYDLVASFRPKKYSVKFTYDPEIVTLNEGNGIYEYGTTLSLKAEAARDYRITGFVVNGVKVTDSNQLDYLVDDNTEIELLAEYIYKYVLLDEDIEYNPADVEYANVTLKRSFRKGYWNTICLPCDVNDPAEVFGANTIVARLSGLSGGTLQFDQVVKMEANVPYLIKVGSVQSSVIATGENKSSMYSIKHTSVEAPLVNGTTDQVGDVSFIGTYDVSPIPLGAGNYYLSTDTFFYVDSDAVGSKTSRFRGYFHTGQSMSKIHIGTDKIVGIDDASVLQQGDIYNMQGIKIRSAANGFDGLKSGLYIMNGHKFMVK